MRSPWLCTALAFAGWCATSACAQETYSTVAPATQAQVNDHANCFCRAQGRSFAVGQNVCLHTPDGPRIAECGMVLNNTSWHFTDRPCPET